MFVDYSFIRKDCQTSTRRLNTILIFQYTLNKVVIRADLVLAFRVASGWTPQTSAVEYGSSTAEGRPICPLTIQIVRDKTRRFKREEGEQLITDYSELKDLPRFVQEPLIGGL